MAKYRDDGNTIVDAERANPLDIEQSSRLLVSWYQMPWGAYAGSMHGGTIRLLPGDWLVTHADGTRFTRSPEQFRSRYRPIGDDADPPLLDVAWRLRGATLK